jgi:hypothetical protein
MTTIRPLATLCQPHTWSPTPAPHKMHDRLDRFSVAEIVVKGSYNAIILLDGELQRVQMLGQ